MSKRLLFIGVVVLLVSSAASAVSWSWLDYFYWPFGGPSSQGQITGVVALNGAANYGIGTASSPNSGSIAETQISPSGTATQFSSISVNQYSTVTGNSPSASGVAGSIASGWTFQYQDY